MKIVMKKIIMLGCICIFLSGCDIRNMNITDLFNSGKAMIEYVHYYEEHRDDDKIINNIVELSNKKLWDNAVRDGIKLNGYAKSTFRYAVERGTVDFAYYIIDHGVDLNYRDGDGKNELMYINVWAYGPRYEAFIEKLVKNGCDVQIVDSDGHTLIEDAVIRLNHSYRNHTDERKRIDILLNYGVRYRETTMKVICENAYTYYGALKLLSDLHKKKFPETVPSNCVEAAYLRDSQYLQDNWNEKLSEEDIETAVFFTAALGSREDLAMLMNVWDISPDIQDHEGNSLLMAAASAGNFETFLYLYNEDVCNIKNNNKETVLTAAISGENKDIIEIVSKDEKIFSYYRVNNDDRYEMFSYLIDILALSENVNLLQTCIKNCDFTKDEMKDLCKEVIHADNRTFLKTILQNKDMNKYFKDGEFIKDILGYCCYKPEQVRMILEKVPDAVKPDIVPALSLILRREPVNIIEKSDQIVREFAEAGVPLYEDKSPSPAIIEAASVGDTGAVRELLLCGVDINSTVKKDGRTAMMMASMGDVETLELLLKNGGDVNKCDDSGDTALRYAIGWNAEECVRLLLEYGADKDVVDSDGLSLYDVAVKKGNEKIIGYLK